MSNTDDLMPAWHREALEAEGITEIAYQTDEHLHGTWWGIWPGRDRYAPMPAPNDWRTTGRRLEALWAIVEHDTLLALSTMEQIGAQAECSSVYYDSDAAYEPDLAIGRSANVHEAVARAYSEAVRRGWIGGTTDADVH